METASSHSGVLRSAFAVLLITVLAQILGFLREVAIAGKFGLGGELDALLVALVFPTVIVQPIGQAVSTALLPVIVEARNRGTESAVVSTIVNVALLVSLGLAGLGLIGADAIVKLLAPGLAPQVHSWAASATRITVPLSGFIILGSITKAMLNGLKRYVVPAWVPVIQNLTMLILFLPLIRWGSKGLALGWGIGILCQVFLQGVTLRRTGIRWTRDFAVPLLATVGKAAVPVLVGTVLNQTFVMVDRIFASRLGEGVIAALGYADRIRQLPVFALTVVASSIYFPHLTQAAIRHDMEEWWSHLLSGLRISTVLAVPAVVACIELGKPMVRILFERGAFGVSATAVTSQALAWYSIGILFLIWQVIFMYACYSLRQMKTTIIATISGLAVTILVNVLAGPQLGHQGVAFANTLGNLVEVVVFLVWASQMHSIGLSFVNRAIVAPVVAGIPFYLIVKVMSGVLHIAGENMLLILFAKLTVAVLLGLVVYGICLWSMRVPELRRLGRLVLRKVA